MRGQGPSARPDDGGQGAAVIVVTFPMPAGLVFDWHTHPDHQLAWAASGVLTVRTDAATWVLPPSRALWIPAGLRHETLSAGTATMRTLYIRPGLCPIDWPDFTPVAASPLLAELIGYLEDPGLTAGRRAHAETMLVDLLQPVAMTTINVPMPAEERARQVAEALAADPADGRTLAQWGRHVGASALEAPCPVAWQRHRASVRWRAARSCRRRSPRSPRGSRWARSRVWSATSRRARSSRRSAERPA